MPHFATLKFSNATFCDIKKILMLRFETLKLFLKLHFALLKVVILHFALLDLASGDFNFF